MPQDGRPKRGWREVAEEASHERDPDRLLELAKELEQALDERDKLPAQPQPPQAKKKSA
jgi:hypothetical protein